MYVQLEAMGEVELGATQPDLELVWVMVEVEVVKRHDLYWFPIMDDARKWQ